MLRGITLPYPGGGSPSVTVPGLNQPSEGFRRFLQAFVIPILVRGKNDREPCAVQPEPKCGATRVECGATCNKGGAT